MTAVPRIAALALALFASGGLPAAENAPAPPAAPEAQTSRVPSLPAGLNAVTEPAAVHAAPGGAAADTPPPTLTAEALADFEWFGSLSLPDVNDLPFGRVAYSYLPGATPEAPSIVLDYRYGFVLPDGLSEADFLHHFPTLRKRPGSPGHPEQDLQAASFPEYARSWPNTEPKPTGLIRFRSDPNDIRLRAFALAWACWRRGLPAEAARLYEFAQSSPESPPALRLILEEALASRAMGNITQGFRGTESRAELHAQLLNVARNFPRSPLAPRAREVAALVEVMVAEDAAHQPIPDDQLAALPVPERVRELIYRLRDATGTIGHRAVRASDGRDLSPLGRQLRALCPEALPQLVAALDCGPTATVSRPTPRRRRTTGCRNASRS